MFIVVNGKNYTAVTAMRALITKRNVLGMKIIQVVIFKMYVCLTKIHLIEFVSLTDFSRVLQFALSVNNLRTIKAN